MSFARFGPDSDVYVYQCKEGFECCGCWLSQDWIHPTASAIIDHLGKHKKAGHRVPQDAINELVKCQATDGDES